MKILALFSLMTLGRWAYAICPPTGPVLPPPVIDPSVFSDLKPALDSLSNAKSVPWNTTTHSFSVTGTSKTGTVFSYHYTAPLKNATGKQMVDGDTIYRVASVTKVFTVLAVLLERQLNLDDPITAYVEEFNQPGWEDVTLRMLCSQISNIPRNASCTF